MSVTSTFTAAATRLGSRSVSSRVAVRFPSGCNSLLSPVSRISSFSSLSSRFIHSTFSSSSPSSTPPSSAPTGSIPSPFASSSSTSSSVSKSPSSSSSSSSIRGMLTLSQLRDLISSDQIESVIVAFPDMYGRLMGKRFDAQFFLESCLKDGTHACDYLLASDIEMVPQPGYEYANWERGFGDFHMVPDLSSLRLITWQDRVAMVICDIENDKTHSLVSVAPRSVLKRQIDAAASYSYNVFAASELEYYMYEHSYRDAHKLNYRQSSLTPVGDYLEDYHILQTAREEKYTKVFRQHLRDSGIPVENSKGECGIGQHELNVKYSDILTMSDRHAVYKQCLKEVADQLGASVTFMAKPFTDATGSGCHIHLSMFHKSESGKSGNAFVGNETLGSVKGVSKLFIHFLAGWLRYTPDCMVFYAPTINSYKRFQSASWAPTRLSWSYDNRTAGFRVVGHGNSLRIECRIPGADCNPYLAFAASLASGLKGVKDQLLPPPIFEGNIYEAKQLPEVPKSLTESVRLFESSSFAKEAFGEDVVRHYAHFYRKEQESFDKSVTDWERVRYFERI